MEDMQADAMAWHANVVEEQVEEKDIKDATKVDKEKRTSFPNSTPAQSEVGDHCTLL